MLVEWKAKERYIPQRMMGEHPENLERVVLGIDGESLIPVRGQMMLSVRRPQRFSKYHFDVVYDLMMRQPKPRQEITFSVRLHDRRLVLW